MPVVAADPVVVVALVGVALLVAVIAVALLFIARILRQVSRRLEAIVAAAGEAPPEVPGAEDMLKRINADLKAGQDLLDDADAPEDAERE